jgi:hypothetical protein
MKHHDHEFEYLKESFSEQVRLIVWVSLLTLLSAGAIIALALSI